MNNSPGKGCHVGFMRNHEHGDAMFSIQCPKQLHDLNAPCGIEIAGGFVSKQNDGLRNNGPGNRNSLLLTAR